MEKELIKEFPFLVCKIDSNDYITYVSDIFKKLIKDKENKTDIKNLWKDIIHDEDINKTLEGYKEAKLNKKTFKVEHRLKLKDTYKYHLSVCEPIIGKNKTLEGYFCIEINIDEKKKEEDRLKSIGFHDSLTLLHNRTFFDEEIETLSKQIKRNLLNPYTVFMIDINGLKFVNDNFGHGMGDKLLKIVADIIKESIRETDDSYRLGGDEFAIIARNCDENTAKNIGKRIQNNINKYNKVNEKASIYVSISKGYATSDGKEMPKSLLKRADKLMYEDKNKLRQEVSLEMKKRLKDKKVVTDIRIR